MNYQNDTARVAGILANIPQLKPPGPPSHGNLSSFQIFIFDILKKVVGTLDAGKMGLLLQEDIFTQEYK